MSSLVLAHQTLHLVSVGGLIPLGDESNYSGVICKFDYGVAEVSRGAFMGIEGVEQGACGEPVLLSECGLTESPYSRWSVVKLDLH